MFEVTLLLLVMLLIAACAFLPWGCSMSSSPKSFESDDAGYSCSDSELSVPEDSAPKPHFLTHLKSEIESALFPRPTDSILQRHYDALVNTELENRLAAMPDS